MNEIHILIQPIEYPLTLENLIKCFNCGSTVLIAKEEWGILKEDYFNSNPREEEPFRVVRVDVSYFCAVCGNMIEGYAFYGEDLLEKKDYDSKEDAESYLDYLEKQKVKSQEEN